MRAAIRFLRSQAEVYHLDPDRIIASGYSAGAATALHLSFVPNIIYWNEEGDSGNPGFNSEPNGVIAIAGYFFPGWTEMLKGVPFIKNFEDLPPVIFEHGTDDEVCPYAYTKGLHDFVKTKDVPSKMISLQGNDHDIFRNDLVLRNPYLEDMTTTLYEFVTKGGQAPEGCSLIE